ncbi:hypothetical protein BJ875DRAFT_219818 [Amylocarpus encephaloides]|uniref:Uncharacterized protein n=1 Tax=Amylocarpus encephaloides TaxID=45428 RepID=A0A9P8C9U7_9HELO|nr:hypothetical protein BJ875DRAFT_219818 [Amylocarpus encephaloides]
MKRRTGRVIHRCLARVLGWRVPRHSLHLPLFLSLSLTHSLTLSLSQTTRIYFRGCLSTEHEQPYSVLYETQEVVTAAMCNPVI